MTHGNVNTVNRRDRVNIKKNYLVLFHCSATTKTISQAAEKESTTF